MMKCVLIVIATVLISSTYGAPDKDGKKHHGEMMKCDGEDLKFTDEMNRGKANCFTKYHGVWNKTEKADKTEMKTADVKDKANKMHHHMNANMTCDMLCKSQALGVISQDGKTDKAKTETYIKTVYPASVQDSLIKSLNTCIDNNPNMAVTSDGNCDSYKPFFKCLFEAKAQACKWSKDAAE